MCSADVSFSVDTVGAFSERLVRFLFIDYFFLLKHIRKCVYIYTFYDSL